MLNGLGRLCCYCPEADKLDYQLLHLEKSLEVSTAGDVDEENDTVSNMPGDRELLTQNDSEAAKHAANNATAASTGSANVSAYYMLTPLIHCKIW